jgi:ribosome biogenesis GTPase
LILRAKIFRSAKRLFDCKRQDTGEMVQAVAHATVLKQDHPVVGDEVELKPSDVSDQFEIVELHPRKNEIYRRIVRENKKKVSAANIDYLVIVSSVSKPVYKAGLIDRYLLRANQWGIPAIVVINKMDEFNEQIVLDFELEKWEKLGAKTFLTSSEPDIDDELKSEMKQFKDFLHGKTAMMVGQSGVGKSRLISTLSEGKVELLSKRLGKKWNKGAHTTTWAEIIDCENFLLVDSPGIRSMAVDDISIDELPSLFPDLLPLFEQCQFNNCRHDENSKGCYFHSLDREDFDDLIILDRLESYCRIRDEVEKIPEWKKG